VTLASQQRYDKKRVHCTGCGLYRNPEHMTETGCRLCDDPAYRAKRIEAGHSIKWPKPPAKVDGRRNNGKKSTRPRQDVVVNPVGEWAHMAWAG